MDIICYKILGFFNQCTGKYYYRRSSITNFIIRCLANFYHHFSSRMLYIYFLKNSSAIICDGNIT